MPTIDYYNKNAKDFVSSTINVDFKDIQNRFLNTLSNKNALILDFGCGAGRDTKYFLEQGYQVEAIDGSERLCMMASEYTGIQVQHMLFQELNVLDKYDGIWACASILHLPIEELIDVLKRIRNALVSEGILYTSFKYGKFSGERNGRYFTDLDEIEFQKILQQVDGIEIKQSWITGDVREGRGGERWLNLILQKI